MAKKDIAVGDNSLSLADIGLAYTKATRLYDKSSLDEKGNLIPFSDQLAIATHYIHLRDTDFADTYLERGQQYVNLWTSNKANTTLDSVCESVQGCF